jgi:urea transporter
MADLTCPSAYGTRSSLRRARCCCSQALCSPSLVLAPVILASSFRTAAGWQTIYPVAFLISIGMFSAVVSMFADIGMPGLQQRALLFLLLLWLYIVAEMLVRQHNGAVRQPCPPPT